MIKRISNIQTLPNFHLQVEFDDGKEVRYNVMEDIESIPAFKPLETESQLFEQVRLDQSRTCVYWNDKIDLPSDAIYEYGETINKTG